MPGMNRAHAESLLASRRLALTPQRRAILDFLESNPGHPTAHDIFAAVTREVPVASRATVYNSLSLFKELGLIREVAVSLGEIRYDGNVLPHHHCRCLSCGTLFDISSHKVKWEWVGEPEAGFRVEGAEVVLEGVCLPCQEGMTKSGTPSDTGQNDNDGQGQGSRSPF